MAKKKKRNRRNQDDAQPRGERLVVRLHKRHDLHYYDDDELQAQVQETFGDLLATLESEHGAVRFAPRYHAVHPDTIRRLIQTAEAAGDFRDPGMLRTFDVHLSPGADPAEVLEHLQGWEKDVDSVTIDPGPTVSPTPAPADKNLETYGKIQYYVEPASLESGGLTYDWGVDAEYAWGVDGGAGDNVSMVDCEGGWKLDHEDFRQDDALLGTEGIQKCLGDSLAEGDFVNGPPDGEIPGVSQADLIKHGTQSLGVVIAQPNATGVLGVAYRYQHVGVSAEYKKVSGGYTSDFHNAVILAIAKLDEWKAAGEGPGVLLLEATHGWHQYDSTLSEKAGAPIEVRPEIHTQIGIAIGNDHVVIEAAGNAGVDLKDLDYDVDPLYPMIDPTDSANDSGAIIVAASNPPVDISGSGSWVVHSTRTTHDRHPLTCYGDRVDCFAWGQKVITCTNVSPWYEEYVNTSAASAIIAGVVMCIQGVAKKRLGAALLPDKVRALLKEEPLSTPSTDPVNDKIGRMPDLKKILQEGSDFKPHGIAPDVYLRDNLTDDGTPHTGSVAGSPDVIVKQTSEGGNDQANLGPATEGDATLSEPVIAGATHYVHLRAKNRGLAAARDVVGRVYWSEVSTLVQPSDWNYIGDVTFDTIPAKPDNPADDTIIVSSEYVWNTGTELTAGHYCYVALIGCDDDPVPSTSTFVDFQAYKEFIRSQNNVTWRNFNVIELPEGPDPTPLPFWAQGAFDEDREFDMHIEIEDEAKVIVEIDMPIDTFERLGETVASGDRVDDGHSMRTRYDATVLPATHGARQIGRGVLPRYDARSAAPVRAQMALHVRLRELTTPDPVDVSVIQLHEGQEVGRVTWRIVPGADDDADSDDDGPIDSVP